MAVDLTEFEAVDETPKTDWDEFEAVPEAAPPIPSPRAIQARAMVRPPAAPSPAPAAPFVPTDEYGVPLEEPAKVQPPKIRVEPWQEPGFDFGPFGGYRPGAPGYAEHMAEAAATSQIVPRLVSAPVELAGKAAVALANIPTRIANWRRGAQPGMPGYVEPIENLPRPKIPEFEGDSEAEAAANVVIRGINSMVPVIAPPETGLTLPFAAGKTAATLFGASIAAQLPEQALHAVDVLADPNTTKAEKIAAVGDPAVQAAFAGLMLRHGLAKPPAEFVGPVATGEVLKMPPGARPPAAPEAPSPVVRAVPPGSVPPEAVVPGVRLIGGEVVEGRPGETHPDIIEENKIPAKDIDQRVLVDKRTDTVMDREAAAQGTGLTTEREPGRLHSTDLPAAKGEALLDMLSAKHDLTAQQSEMVLRAFRTLPEGANAEALQKAFLRLALPADMPLGMGKVAGLKGAQAVLKDLREASAGVKELTAGEAEKPGPTTLGTPPPARAEEGARETVTPTPPPEVAPAKPAESVTTAEARAIAERDRAAEAKRLAQAQEKARAATAPESGKPDIVTYEDALFKAGVGSKVFDSNGKVFRVFEFVRSPLTDEVSLTLRPPTPDGGWGRAKRIKLSQTPLFTKSPIKPPAPEAPSAAPSVEPSAELFPDLKGRAPTLDRVRRAIGEEEANYESLYEAATRPDVKGDDPIHDKVDLSERRLRRLRDLGSKLEAQEVKQARIVGTKESALGAKATVETVAPEPPTQRTTPRKGTPERESLSQEYDRLYAPVEKLYDQIAKLTIERDKTTRYSKKYEALDKRIDKLREQRDAADSTPELKAIREKLRKAYSEDRLESPNPITVAKEKSELGDREAYQKSKDQFVEEAKRQGFSDDDAQKMFLDAWSYTIERPLSLHDLVKERGGMAKAEQAAKQFSKEVESLDLPENERYHAKAVAENYIYQPEKLASELARLREISEGRVRAKTSAESRAKAAAAQERVQLAKEIQSTPPENWNDFVRLAAKQTYSQLNLAKKALQNFVERDRKDSQIYRYVEGGKPRWVVWLTRDAALKRAADILAKESGTLEARAPVIPRREAIARLRQSVLRNQIGIESRTQSIISHLQERHGVRPGGFVKIEPRPEYRGSAGLEYPLDERGNPILDPETGKPIPTGIWIDPVKFRNFRELDENFLHEVSHFYDLTHRTEVLDVLREHLSDSERAAVQKQVREVLKYDRPAWEYEERARDISRLADAWRGRNFFERLVGNIQRFAAEKLKFRMTRLAAESAAVRALARSLDVIRDRGTELADRTAIMSSLRDSDTGGGRPAPPVPKDQFPPLPKATDKVVQLERPDGTRYDAAADFSGREWAPEMVEALGIQSGKAIHRITLDSEGNPGWSTGMLDKGERIVGETGALEARAPGAPEPISELSERLRATAPVGTRERLSARERMADAWSKGKTLTQRAGARAVAIGQTIKDAMRGFRSPTELDAKVGELDFLLQRSAAQSREAGRVMVRQVKDPNLRRAAALWIDTPGDAATKRATLQGALSSLPAETPRDIRRAIETAANMPPEAIAFADQLRDFFETRERDAIEAGLFGEMDRHGNVIRGGLDDYFTHIWGKEANMPDDLRAAISNGRVQTYWQFARQRQLGMFLDGILAGKVPELDPSKVIPFYNYTLDRSMASRAFIKEISDNVTASDGRAAVAPTGVVSRIGPVTAPDATLVRPKGKLEAIADYRAIDHPAMRKWKWVTNDENGNPILSMNDLVVHPEFYERLARFMDRGRLTPTRWGRVGLRLSTEVKGFKLGLLSAFHQVHVGSHALWHWTLPFNFKDPAYFTPEGHINWDSPQVRQAVERGHLKLAPDPNELNVFAEGLLSPGLVHKLPIIGPWSRAYSEFVFTDLIPKLKLKTYANALPRNERWYSGKLSPDEIAARVGDSVNNAYGELNHLFLGRMGRDPKLTRMLRAIFLAPDFGEARLRFAGKVFTKFGGEERLAMATMVATLYFGARIANWLTHGDAEAGMDKESRKHMFSVKVGNHWYSLRSVVGDLNHAMTDPGRFFYVRLNPLYSRTAADWLFGRDVNGRKLSPMDRLITRPAEQLIPINLQGISQYDRTLLESALTSMGLQTIPDTPQRDMHDAATRWAQSQPDPKIRREAERREQSVFAPSDYIKLRFALSHDDAQAAQKAYDELLATGHTTDAVYNAMHREAPFTGNIANERKFVASLTAVQKKIYQQAVNDRRQMFHRFLKLRRFPGQSAPVSDSLILDTK